MKRILFILALIIGLSASTSHAQMGHGMMRGGHMDDQKDHMMESPDHMQLDDIFTRKQRTENEMSMHNRQVMNGMMGATQDMAIMMRQMSVMMGNVTDMKKMNYEQSMQRMSAIMKNMSMEMNRISVMMGKGTASAEELKAMQESIVTMREQVRKLKTR